ncbi:hypothetical protein [Amycolatopsis sp. H20-H5]|uniref:hypothetical protein n=1 Tax=Amycolatopsis sp. H20-H5 TaxID=3046309 RepID=UPI002DBA94C1|nr:hypothetical protein [Amycolatopsis sp. H20-H5]MEC3979884.1 hypothetical protein [Amycolatopsis sp. H20-H5]
MGLAVLRMHTARYDYGSEKALQYRRVVKAVSHLLSAAVPDLVDEYTDMLSKRFGRMLDLESVLELASEEVQDDPIANAIHALEERDIKVHADGPAILHVHGTTRNPALAALEAIAAAEEVTLATWAENNTGRWALLIWQAPDLYCIEHADTVQLWHHYRCSRRITPRTLARARDFELAERVRYPARITPIPQAVTAALALGIEMSHPLACPRSQVEDHASRIARRAAAMAPSPGRDRDHLRGNGPARR